MQVSKQELHNHKYMNQPSKPTGANVLPIVQHVYVSATITDTVRSVGANADCVRQLAARY